MFARSVSLRLKPDTLTQFTQILENEIVPLLRQQEGFQDEITFATVGSPDVIAMSIWDTQEHLEAYNQKTFPQVLKSLETVLDGTPRVKVRTVISTTIGNATAAAKTAA
jgi:quinol monooxygenase YgiN